RIEAAADVVELLGSGLALCRGNVLRPIIETTLSGANHDNLPIEKLYEPARLSELVTEVLPALRREMPVVITSKRLPRTKKNIEPRIHFAIEHSGAALHVLPTLVYGDPAIARI